MGEEIVLDRGDLRWTFSDIEADAFRWRNEAQQPDGMWWLQQTFRVWRQTCPSARRRSESRPRTGTHPDLPRFAGRIR